MVDTVGARPFEYVPLTEADADRPLVSKVTDTGQVVPDVEQGAGFGTRVIVGATRPQDQLQTLKNLGFTDIQALGEGNFIFTDPQTGKRTLYNPSGFDFGDVAEFARMGVQAVTTTIGAGLGAVSPVPGGAAIGAGIGNVAGGQAFDVAARGAGQADTRTTGETLTEAGIEGAAGTAGQAAAPFISKGISAAATGAVRAGQKGIRNLAGAVDDFSIIDDVPSLGQAGSNLMQVMEAVTKRSLGGIRPMRNQARRILGKFDKAVKARTRALGGTSAEEAGSIAKQGVEQFVERFKAKGSQLYDAVGELVPDHTASAVRNTERILGEITSVDPSAPLSTGRFVNQTIKSISDDLAADAAENGGTISFSALSLIRSRVGAKIANPSLADDVPRGEWKRLYGAITEDMLESVQANGSEGALKAFSRANEFWKSGLAKIDDVLEPLVSGKFPEKIFTALESSGKFGSSLMKEVREAVTPEQWRSLVGTALDRMGRATPGTQNAAGDAFSVQTFLTNWAKLPPQTKAVMFNNTGIPGMRADLDKLSRVAERLTTAEKFFANPSGSAQVGAAQFQVGSGVTAALTGNFGTAAVLLAGLPALTRGSAAFLTSPRLVKWLAQGAKIPPNRIGSHLGRLTAIAATSDPETRESIREYLENFSNVPERAATRAARREDPDPRPVSQRTNRGPQAVPPPGLLGRR